MPSRSLFSKQTESNLPLGATYRNYALEPRHQASLDIGNVQQVSSETQADTRVTVPDPLVDPKLLESFPQSDVKISRPPYGLIAITVMLFLICYTIGTVAAALVVFQGQRGYEYNGGSIAAIILGYLFALVSGNLFWLLCRRRLAEWKIQSESLSLESGKWKLFLREKDREARYCSRFQAGSQANTQSQKSATPAVHQASDQTNHRNLSTGSSMPIVLPLNISRAQRQYPPAIPEEYPRLGSPTSTLQSDLLSRDTSVNTIPMLLQVTSSSEHRYGQETTDRKEALKQRLVRSRHASDPSLAYFQLQEQDRTSAEHTSANERVGPEMPDYQRENYELADFKSTNSQASGMSGWTHRLELRDSTESIPLAPGALEDHPALRAVAPHRQEYDHDHSDTRVDHEDTLLTNAVNFPERQDSLKPAIGPEHVDGATNPVNGPSHIDNGSPPISAVPLPSSLNKENLKRVSQLPESTKKAANWIDGLDRAAHAEEEENDQTFPVQSGAETDNTRLPFERRESAVTDLKSLAGKTQANESQAVGPPSAIRVTPATEGEMMWEIEEESSGR